MIGFKVIGLPNWADFVAYEDEIMQWYVCERTTGLSIRRAGNFQQAARDTMEVLLKVGELKFKGVVATAYKLNP